MNTATDVFLYLFYDSKHIFILKTTNAATTVLSLKIAIYFQYWHFYITYFLGLFYYKGGKFIVNRINLNRKYVCHILYVQKNSYLCGTDCVI